MYYNDIKEERQKNDDNSPKSERDNLQFCTKNITVGAKMLKIADFPVQKKAVNSE